MLRMATAEPREWLRSGERDRAAAGGNRRHADADGGLSRQPCLPGVRSAAHNLKAWLAMLALPAEAMRWEWKRFRKAFVYIAARVVLTARAHVLRLAGSHRFAEDIRRGIVRLQPDRRCSAPSACLVRGGALPTPSKVSKLLDGLSGDRRSA